MRKDDGKIPRAWQIVLSALLQLTVQDDSLGITVMEENFLVHYGNSQSLLLLAYISEFSRPEALEYAKIVVQLFTQYSVT